MKTLPSKIKNEQLQPGEFRYAVAAPHNYSGKKPIPLVLALHFAGHGTPYYGRLILSGLVEPALRDLGAIIVAPDCPVSNWTQPQSTEMIMSLLDEIEKTYKIDTRKTLAVGYSMGGVGVWHLSKMYPERFAAGIVMAGRPPKLSGKHGVKMPLYVIHSRADEIMPIAPTERAVNDLMGKGYDIEFVAVEKIKHHATGQFTETLSDAIPWIKKRWRSKSK
ncbi:MAG: dienelactone hydrolase family protein [Desulfobacterales bacterium]|nr:dienelactone hydrolase family protein [Desulfobacterales bacterium]